MTRPIGAISEYTPPDFIDREALMMDGGQLFFQLTPEDSAGDVQTVTHGEVLTGADGRRWRVARTGAGTFGVIPEGLPLTPQNIRPFTGGVFQTALGDFIQVNFQGQIVGSSTSPPPAFPQTTGGTGTTAFSSTRAAAELRGQQEQEAIRLQAKLALERDIENDKSRLKEIEFQEGLVFQRERELLQMRIENSQRELIFSQIGAERRTLIQEKGAARRQQTELAGKRPFRFAFNIRGEQPSGPTPFDIQSAQNLAFINQPLPTASLNAPIGQLESTLTGLQNIQAPTPGLFGMAHGGVIEMEKGQDGAFSQKQAFLVGENPDGTINKTTEVMTIGGGKVEVVPLVGGAQGGLELPFREGVESLEKSLVQIITQRVSSGVPLEEAIAAAIKRLREVRPSVDALAAEAWAKRVRDFLAIPPPSTGSPLPISFPELGSPTFAESIFFPVPAGGLEEILAKRAVGQVGAGVPIDIAVRTAVQRLNEVRPGNPLAMFQWGQRLKNAIQAAPTRASIAPLADLPFLQMIQRPNRGFQNLNLTTGLQDMGLSPFQASQLGGLFTLPDPGKFARTFTQELEPTEQRLTRELFELAGVPEESFDFQIRQATPTGRSFRPQRIGFTGTRF